MNTSFLDDIFTISHNGKDVVERKDSNNKMLWERAIPKTTSKSASISLTNTRKTGGDGVTYPVFAPSKVLPSVVAYGKCVQSDTPTPDVPKDIVCNNGALKAFYGNKYTDVGAQTGKILQQTGHTIESNSNYSISAPIFLKAGEYTVSYTADATGSSPFLICEALPNGNPVPAEDGEVWYKGRPTTGLNTDTFTVDHDMNVLISLRITFTDVFVGPVSAITYADGTHEVITVADGGTGQTASVTDLFAIEEYEDTQNVMTGAVTRSVGIEVFDGTEDWKSGNNTGLYYVSLAGKKYEKSLLISTHFTYSSATSTQITHGEMMCGGASANTYFRNTDCAALEDWRAWLASQYAAGTPVMVVYPLATPQTEQVALPSEPIALDHKGTYTLSTSGSVSNLQIQATYLGR